MPKQAEVPGVEGAVDPEGRGGEEELAGRETHYVVVVHGTLNGPKPGATKWWQPGGELSVRLNKTLAKGPLGEAVWRGVGGPVREFSWHPCGNEHHDRVAAAERLAEYFKRLVARDPDARIHVIAHSHGGNVLLRALELHEAGAREQASLIWAKAHDLVYPASQVGGGPPTRSLSPQMRAGTALDLSLQEYLKRPLSSFSGEQAEALRSLEQGLAHRSIGDAGKDFEDRWLRVGPDNIGRLVFLGTPFFYKHFQRGSSLRRGWDFGVDLLAGLLYGVAVAYPATVMIGLLSRLGGNGEFIGLDPLAWPWWIRAIVGAAVVGIALTGAMAKRVRDGNLYYRTPSVRGLDALVISARGLDEALLAMSSESIVLAYLLPRLRELSRAPLWRRLDAAAELIDPESPAQAGRRLSAWVGLQLLNVVMLPMYPLRKALSRVFERYLLGVIRKLATATGFGLSTDEWSRARVDVRAELDLEGPHRIRHRDVTRLLAETPAEGSKTPAKAEPSTETAEAAAAEESHEGEKHPGQRYRFLWDDRELSDRLSSSSTWEKLKKELDVIEPRRDVAELQRLALMVDTRIDEVTGAVELFHSSYYTNPVVLQEIARFLEGGDEGQGLDPA